MACSASLPALPVSPCGTSLLAPSPTESSWNPTPGFKHLNGVPITLWSLTGSPTHNRATAPPPLPSLSVTSALPPLQAPAFRTSLTSRITTLFSQASASKNKRTTTMDNAHLPSLHWLDLDVPHPGQPQHHPTLKLVTNSMQLSNCSLP